MAWLGGKSGLHLGPHGSLLSANAFQTRNSGNDGSGTLEIWLEPARSKGRKTILVFEGFGDGATFSLQEMGSELIVQRRNVDGVSTIRTAEAIAEGVFFPTRPTFVTITMGPRDTTIYINGVLTKASMLMGDPTATLFGRLVLGNSLTTSDSWVGQIYGLAIFDKPLTPDEILARYRQWEREHSPELSKPALPVALYLFNEREGSLVHNQVDSKTDLTIPRRFFVLHPRFLSAPLHDFSLSWSYWSDVFINIAGLIPFGFLFAAYFSTVRTIKYPFATTVLLGFLTSLTIEVFQAYLPTRDSGMNDLVTNSFGSMLGVLLFRSTLVQALVNKIAILERLWGSKGRGSIEVGTLI